jgi:hypothetical protein
VWDLGLRLSFRGEGLRVRFWSLQSRVEYLGFGVCSLGLRAQGIGFRV